MPVLKKVNKSFFKKWSPEMAYVLGFFAADGYITVNKRGGQFLCIQIIDKRLLEQIREALQSEHKISTRVMRENESTLYCLQIGSIEMCDDLRKLGFSERKTKNLVIPNVSKKYFPDFVRGYFDGDGNIWMGEVNKKRKTPSLTLTTMFTSCSVEFLEGLRKGLHSFGLKGGSIFQSKANYSRLQFSADDSLKLYDFMYNEHVRLRKSLFLERKRVVFENFKKVKRNAAVAQR